MASPTNERNRIMKKIVKQIGHSGPSLPSPHNLNLPWSLDFYRDGTEDVTAIRDAHEDYLVTSRPFRLPEGDDPVPLTLAAIQVMAAAPDLLTFVSTIARMTQDGEEIDGREFVMENDDAVDTLNQLIDSARHLLAETTGKVA